MTDARAGGNRLDRPVGGDLVLRRRLDDQRRDQIVERRGERPVHREVRLRGRLERRADAVARRALRIVDSFGCRGQGSADSARSRRSSVGGRDGRGGPSVLTAAESSPDEPIFRQYGVCSDDTNPVSECEPL